VALDTFLYAVMAEYTYLQLPTLERALRRAAERNGVAEAALPGVQRLIIQVLRDRGASLESVGGETQFTWPGYGRPLRAYIIAGLRELAEHPERWIKANPITPDCDGDQQEVFGQKDVLRDLTVLDRASGRLLGFLTEVGSRNARGHWIAYAPWDDEGKQDFRTVKDAVDWLRDQWGHKGVVWHCYGEAGLAFCILGVR
jgi:hypothetical protein